MNSSSDNSLQLSGHSDLQIVVNSLFDGVPYPSQFAADSSRSWLRILLSGYVHPGPTTRFPCPVCARNVTGHGVGYLCNRSGWVHSKCSGLQNAAVYRRIKDWVCFSFSSPPLYQSRNRCHHQFQYKLSMGIHSPSHHSTQIARQQTDGIR